MHKYMPVLKSKKGEFDAICKLSSDIRDSILPLIELTEMDFDHDKNAYRKIVDDHVASVCNRLGKCWDEGNPIIIDFSELQSFTPKDKDHVIELIHEALIDNDINYIPLISSQLDDDTEDQLISLIDHDTRVAIRVFTDEVNKQRKLLKMYRQVYGLKKKNIDFILDLGEVSDSVSKHSIVETSMNKLGEEHGYNSVQVIGTSIPKSIANKVGPRCSGELQRHEWHLWKNIYSDDEISLNPIYGDFCNRPYSVERINPRIYHNSRTATMKYTSENVFFVVRSGPLVKETYEVSHALAKTIIDSSHYKDKNFSFGDKYYYDLANNKTSGPGGATQWLTADVNHHITYVFDQLSSLIE